MYADGGPPRRRCGSVRCARFKRGGSATGTSPRGLGAAVRGSAIEVPAVATDDVHKSRDVNLGWTMVRAESLTPAAITEAIRNGCSYASHGPVIEDFGIRDGVVRIACSPAAVIQFLYDGSGGGRTFRAPASAGMNPRSSATSSAEVAAGARAVVGQGERWRRQVRLDRGRATG